MSTNRVQFQPGLSLSVILRNDYDAFKRLTTSTNASGGQTRYNYNADGRLTSITDPKGTVTAYSVDGLGQVWRVGSPDTGVTTFEFNASGQQTTARGADGTVLSFGYLGDGRLSTIAASRAGLSQTRTYVYDTCANGKGRVCAVVESNGERVDYSYTTLGAMAAQTHTIAGQAFTTQWTYQAATGLVATMRYPNGVVLTYGWADGLLRTVDATVNGVTRRIVDQALYQPFGPLSSFIDSTGRARIWNFDMDGRVRTLYSAAQSWSYAYDRRNLIAGISGSDLSAATYDELGRLKTATQTGLNASFGFDANGNRTQATYSTSPTLPVSYTINSASNQLLGVAWNGSTRSLAYDAAGNLVRDQRSATQTDCHRYDAFGRLEQFARYNANVPNCASTTAVAASLGQYRSNGLGQRTYKAAAGKQSRYVYGAGGELLYETTAPASAYADKTYIWFGGAIVAMVANGTVHSVYSDHLGRPLSVQTPTRTTVWSATLRAFDRSVVTDQIGGFNVGYPGQYHDAESGLAYNHHRYYDPGLGRYTQSDPIGLAGGINTYDYVGGNPLMYTDPLGLWSVGDPLPQGVVNACAGFGDGVSLGLTAGIRELMGTNGAVDFSSTEYLGGVVAGVAVTTRGYATGAELSIGRNLRIAPWGNRTGHPTGRYPHYHRRGAPDANGNTPPGQGIGRHRPWDKKSTDKCSCDRF